MRAITAVIAALGMFGVLAASAPARADEDNHDGDWRRQDLHERERRERAWN